MARVVVVFEDIGANDINIRLEATDPPLPLSDGDLDVDEATPAQCAARMAVGEVAGQAAAAQIIAVPR